MKTRTNPTKRKTENERIVERLELPKDLFLGLPLLSMQGNRLLAVTNHRGIVRYSTESVVIAAQAYRIQVTGRELVLPRYSSDLVEVSGVIDRIDFVV